MLSQIRIEFHVNFCDEVKNKEKSECRINLHESKIMRQKKMEEKVKRATFEKE